MWRSAPRAFIAGRPGGQTLEQAVAAIRQANAESEALVARRTSITRLFIEEGLQAYLPEEYSRYHSWDGIFNNGMVGEVRVACTLPAWFPAGAWSQLQCLGIASAPWH